jgi:UDP:flavonoid glycosyltransferase YjiC (YdhE family)
LFGDGPNAAGVAVRVLVSTTPHLGHFLPLVPVANELVGRGHDVVVASEPGFAGAIHREGLEAAGVGRDLSVEDVLAVLPELASVAADRQDAYARPRVFIDLRANNVFSDLERMISEWQPDLVVREGAELASWALAERHQLAHVTVGVAGPAREWEAMAGPQIAELGRRASVPALRADSMYKYGLLVFEPAGFRDWSDTPTARVYRPFTARAGAVDDRVAAFDDHPIVYTTLGTEFFDPIVMRTMLDAATRGERNVIATIGRGQDPNALALPSERLVIAEWIDQGTLLGHVAVVLCHGGTGTVTAPLVHGVPVVVIPRGADQFANAERVGSLGAGIVLPFEQQDADSMDAAITSVLHERHYRVAVQRIADDTARLPGTDAAADYLEATANT